MGILVYLLLFLALTKHSTATYCICKDGVGDQSLQKTLDYACGAGADCTSILQNGACFQPNTVKDHCNWAVNSYFQRKGQTTGSCDFSGTAMPSQTPPSNVPSTCAYPASPGTTGTSPTSTTSQTTPSTTIPTTSPTTGFTSPSTTTTPPGGVGTSPMFGISPTGSGTGITDNTGGGVALSKFPNVLSYAFFALWLVLLRA